MKQLYWHNGADDPLQPFKNNGISEIQQLVGGKVIRKTQWSTCRVTNNLSIRVICEDSSVYRFFLDWYYEYQS